MIRRIHDHEVRGVEVDPETRCAHYDTERDVVALKLGCCETYYPCFRCHEELADHEAEPWPTRRSDDPAAMCGACGVEFTGEEYMDAENCPSCGMAFNPGCADHYPLYFEWAGARGSSSRHDG